MGLRIQNNIAAMNAQRQLSISNQGLNQSLERLSSGFRINRAADDAAGLAISQSFRAEIASYKVASRNASEANALLQVAEGAMDQMGNILTRLKELATQAASDNAGLNRDKIDAEAQALLVEYQRIATSTEYAGAELLTGALGGGVEADLRANVQASIIDPTGSNEIWVSDTAIRGEYTFSFQDSPGGERGAEVTLGSEVLSVSSVSTGAEIGTWTISDVSTPVEGLVNIELSNPEGAATATITNVTVGEATSLDFTVGTDEVTIALADGWTVEQLEQAMFDVYAMRTVTAESTGQIEDTNIGGLGFEIDSGGITARGIYELTAAQGLTQTTFTLTNTLTGYSQDAVVANTDLSGLETLTFGGDIAMDLTFTAGQLSADSTATIVYGGLDATLAFDTRAEGTGEVMAFEHFELPLKDGWTWQQINDMVMEITGGPGVPGESMIFQIGALDRPDHQLEVSLGDARLDAVGLTGLSLLTREGAQLALGTVDTAVDNLANVRGDIGAYMNTLQYAMADIATTIENVQAAESVIRDADMAAEMTEFVKYQILVQAGTAMLAQANMAPQSVLALLG